MKKDLLKLLDFSKQEIIDLLDLADQLKYEKKHQIDHKYLKGKTLGMIFQKSSTRTRVSFEAGMYQLGGHALFLSGNDLQIGRGEPIEDTARVLSRYLDGIMIRTFKQSDIETIAQMADIPVINGLSDDWHPCQVLADLMTIRESKGRLDGIKMAYLGDGNNMANSLIVGGLKTGMTVSIATPKDYQPSSDARAFAKDFNNFTLTDSIKEAVADADVLVTDVWTSMGQEQESKKRMQDFAGYCIDDALLKEAKSDAIVLHCLPAHRGEEITAEVFDKHSATIFEEAENRLHAQKAVMVKLMSK